MASDNPLLPARVRRLTNAEYAASVFALLGVNADAAVATFPRDATQKLGFTVNDAQIVSSVLAGQLDTIAQQIVTSARQVGEIDFLAPCDDPVSDGETCARTFIQSFAAKAYRRPAHRRRRRSAARSLPRRRRRGRDLRRRARLRDAGDPAGARASST